MTIASIHTARSGRKENLRDPEVKSFAPARPDLRVVFLAGRLPPVLLEEFLPVEISSVFLGVPAEGMRTGKHAY